MSDCDMRDLRGVRDVRFLSLAPFVSLKSR